MSFHLHCYYCGPSHSISQLHSWNNVLTNLPASNLPPCTFAFSILRWVFYNIYDYVTPRFQAFPSFIFWPSEPTYPHLLHWISFGSLNSLVSRPCIYCFICLEDFSLSSDYFPLTKMNKRKVLSIRSLLWYIWTSLGTATEKEWLFCISSLFLCCLLTHIFSTSLLLTTVGIFSPQQIILQHQLDVLRLSSVLPGVRLQAHRWRVQTRKTSLLPFRCQSQGHRWFWPTP